MWEIFPLFYEKLKWECSYCRRSCNKNFPNMIKFLLSQFLDPVNHRLKCRAGLGHSSWGKQNLRSSKGSVPKWPRNNKKKTLSNGNNSSYSAVIFYISWRGSRRTQAETSASECNTVSFLKLNPADTSLYLRLHHAASKAGVDSSAFFPSFWWAAPLIQLRLGLFYRTARVIKDLRGFSYTVNKKRTRRYRKYPGVLSLKRRGFFFLVLPFLSLCVIFAADTFEISFMWWNRGAAREETIQKPLMNNWPCSNI